MQIKSLFGFIDSSQPLVKAKSDEDDVLKFDYWLVIITVMIAALGLIMMTSASITVAYEHFNQPFYYLKRQAIYMLLGIVLAFIIWRIPLSIWQILGPIFLLLSLVLLVLVLEPFFGNKVNGSYRWINFGIFNLQVSELVKLMLIVYMASYLTRHIQRVRGTFRGFFVPLTILGIVAALLLSEPDFGATVVLSVTIFGMLLFAGVRWWQLFLVLMVSIVALFALAWFSPYRWERIVSYLNPWVDPFGKGFQLSNSLIAFGRGEWFGVGLGESVQKLFYLPEAHTDFVFAVLAEELGVVGELTVIFLFTLVIIKCFHIGRLAELAGEFFGAFLAYGVGLWIAFQAYVNIGVNMGSLPTKGLTLPLMSYGGSSAIVTCMAIALVLRVDYEVRYLSAEKTGTKLAKKKSTKRRVKRQSQ